MQPANIAVALRRRTPWEAIDLGLSMLQRWWRAVFIPHLIVGGGLAVAALLLAWYLERPWVAIVLVWWMKPLYDRVVLHVLSRAVFGEIQSPRAVLDAWREWLATGLFAATLFRWWPDLVRSFNLPVRQLEGQTGKAGRERRGVLGRRARSYAVWLTVVCMHFEWVLYLMLGGLAELALPAKAVTQGSGNLFDRMVAGDFWTYGGAIGYAVAVLLLEPFYVAGGFGLYLNRRTLLEGWDIEVALRRLAERHATALLCVVVLCCCVFPMNSYAEKNPKEEIAEVLKAKEFGYEREVTRWQARNPASRQTKNPTSIARRCGASGMRSRAWPRCCYGCSRRPRWRMRCGFSRACCREDARPHRSRTGRRRRSSAWSSRPRRCRPTSPPPRPRLRVKASCERRSACSTAARSPTWCTSAECICSRAIPRRKSFRSPARKCIPTSKS